MHTKNKDSDPAKAQITVGVSLNTNVPRCIHAYRSL